MKRRNMKFISQFLIFTIVASFLQVMVLPQESAQAASPAPLISDNFDTGTLTNWNTVSGTWTNPGAVAQGVSTGDGLLLRSNVSGSDFSYEADIKLMTSKAAGHLYFRSSNTGSNAYAVTLDSSSNVIKLFKFPYVELKSVSQTLTTGTSYHLKVAATGSNIKIYFNNAETPIIDMNDSVYTSGQFGLGSYAGTVQMDNVVATDTSIPAPTSSVKFSLNGNAAPAKSVSTVVTVTGADTSPLQYQWTKNNAAPDGATWTPFASEEMIQQRNVDGDWYLYIRYTDTKGDLQTIASKPFHLNQALVTAGAEAGQNGTHWGFESGTLEGWTAPSNASDIPILASNEFFHNTPTTPYNKAGQFFLSTLEGNNTYGDSYNAVVVSPEVTLSRPTVSMLVGGGNGSNVYVAACTVDATKPYKCNEVGKVQGTNAENMQQRSMNLSAYLGQKIFFKMVDSSTTAWGHITLDDVFVNIPASPAGLSVSQGTTANTLTWQAVTEADVTGYNVYRSINPEKNFIQLNDTPVLDASYQDTTAENNQTYYYRVTTIGTDGSESAPSRVMAFYRPEQDLYGRGSTVTYTGSQLTAIQFPVGPIGAGGIRHFGTGERSEAWIFNSDDTFRNSSIGLVPNSFFAVRAKSEGDQPIVRALQTKAVGAFQAMKSLTFQGEFPLGRFDFQDDQLPIQVQYDVFNPMIPDNLKDSAIPTAIYTMTFKNPTNKHVDVSLLASQQNAVGFDGKGTISGAKNRDFNGYGSNKNVIQTGSDGAHLQMTGSNGSMTLSVSGTSTSGTAAWDTLDTLQASFANGDVNGAANALSPLAGTTVDGALTSSLNLAPGESKQVRVVLSWYFPQNPARNFGGEGMQYTNWWSNASDVDQYVRTHLTTLEAKTKLYHDTLYSSNLPQYVLDRLTSATALLHTPTVFWAKNGFFGGWEGYGCCDNMPNHVWHYAQAHSRLWPELGQMFDQQWLDAVRPDGLLPYRYDTPTFSFDGQNGVILSAYRDYLQSSDTDWMTKYWPKIKLAMDYVINHHDPKKNGILEGAALTTLDATSPTNSSWLGSMYLAAVNASSKMARAAGDTASADLYESIYSKGRVNQENMLWNGQYYIEQPINASNADKVLGNGLEIDMLLGQWWSSQLGLGDIYDSDHMKIALKNLFEHNYYNNFIDFVHQYRTYVEPTDAGMIMSTWPNNDRPSNSIHYFDEVMSGFEYSAAAEMLRRGMLEEGLTIVNAASNRYDGRLRNDSYMTFGGCGIGDGTGNPFGDDECGQWYGRTLSSWSLLLSLQGFTYDAPNHTIGFAPTWQPEDHKSFFTSSDGYGTFSQKRSGNNQTSSITVASGKLDLKKVNLSIAEGMVSAGWQVRLNGVPVEGAVVTVDGTNLTASLSQVVTLDAGDMLTVQSGTGLIVTGEQGATSITTKGGTLQMKASQGAGTEGKSLSVTWSVYGAERTMTDLATISADGLLQAVKDGNVTVVATAADGSGATGEAVIAIRGQSDTPALPSGTLKGTSKVTSGQEFTLTYGLKGLTNKIYAQEVTLTYDPEQLELLAAESLQDSFKILTSQAELTKVPGKVNIIAAFVDTADVNNGDWMTLKWRAKSPVAVNTLVTLSNLNVADGEGIETVIDGTTHAITIGEVNKAVLSALITDAQSLHDQAVEGNQSGQYPMGSKAILQTSIDQAKVVAVNPSATQQQVEQAVTDLNEAVSKFKASVNPSVFGDLNGDRKVSIGDLAIVASYYGKTSDDANWSTYKRADMNRDGRIDINDLAAVATLILG
ncbi:GH116 family glycosyl hydrolase [Paenibacillus terrigena]|uniref:GH116 family glycosyl hydrolase n=1 Tax=Paenibacillus terrigena TaxID=369333 RepID=UPI0028D750C9|nr:GH116 family glycosyl hydrolase [Paenibacillus terrigena]